VCGRYNHSRSSHVKKIGPFQVRIDWEPLFNVSPTTLMPVILHEADYETWLKEPREDLLTPYPEEEMEAYRVSTIANNSKNKGEDCIKPWR
jgi:hypothetical protein